MLATFVAGSTNALLQRSPYTQNTLSQRSETRSGLPAALSQQLPPNFDDLYEYYDPDLVPLPQRQQHNPTPLSQRRPASSSSHSTRSLRRKPRFQTRAAPLSPALVQTSRSPRRSGITAQASRVPLDKSDSTTPQSFQRLVEGTSFWPEHTVHISRHTHDAILFALEAIRKGGGGEAKELSGDLLEERARMSDLVGTNLPSGLGTNDRSDYGDIKVDPSMPSSITNEPPRSVRTPTDVMRERRAREARKRQEQEARERENQASQSRFRPTDNVAGSGDNRTSQRRPAGADSGYEQGLGSGEGSQAAPRTRRQENIPALTDPDSVRRPLEQGRLNPSRRPQDSTYRQGETVQAVSNPEVSEGTQRARTEAFETLNIPAGSANPPPSTRLPSEQKQQQQQLSIEKSGRSTFPHAFERWETLSSHWEGLTSYWIRRLQENTNELNGRPIEQQMSRQITDLSAAGANLFHAVVELQRLRASSERKFQRWFFETRNEQERAQEVQAELERQLRVEREERTRSTSSVEAVQAEKAKADELVREMRRELQISKEEARRAWEELGRREQEERERTAALRSGEPTSIGGVQVVPMAHEPSRQTSLAQRPLTRDGPADGGPGPRMMGGQPQAPSRSQTTTTLDSPEDEQRQFTYRPNDDSPTNTDPFIEPRRTADAQQTQTFSSDDQRSYTTTRPTQPVSSNAAIAAARAATNSFTPPSQAYAEATSSGPSSSTPRIYQQPGTDTAIPLTSAPQSSTLHPPPRSGTAGTERSYLASTASGSLGEEEYEINPDGSYTRDAQGRRIPYGSSDVGRIQQDDDDEYDVQAEIERERALTQRYRPPQGQSAGVSRTTAGQLPQPLITPNSQAGNGQRHSAYAQVTTTSQQLQPASIAETSPELGEVEGEVGAVDYSGSGYGGSDPTWSGVAASTPRHRHPTRLSDILEERSGRTSPSRGSYISGGAEGSRGGDFSGQYGPRR